MKAHINITPYVDILLVLLIIFMVIQPVTQYEMRARISQKRQGVSESAAQPILLSIDRHLNLSVNGEAVRLHNLGTRLFELLSRRSDKRLFVSADGELAFGNVVRAIDIAKGAGAGDIGLLKE